MLPQAHGTGAAALLMARALDWARQSGAAGVWLGVNQQNERAQRFYGKSGFERVGIKRFLVGGVYEDDYVMERALDPRPVRSSLPGRSGVGDDGDVAQAEGLDRVEVRRGVADHDDGPSGARSAPADAGASANRA